jgi:Tol biopolymer transport system component
MAIVNLTTGLRTEFAIDEFPDQVFHQAITWSPNSDAFAFASSGNHDLPMAVEGDPSMDLYLANPDGSEITLLPTDSLGRFGNLNWTTTDHLIFSATGVLDSILLTGVFSLDIHTGQLTLLSDPAQIAYNPAVSPDETRIAYVRYSREIMVMNMDGSDPQVIASLNGNIFGLDWQPIITNISPAATPAETTPPAIPTCRRRPSHPAR